MLWIGTFLLEVEGNLLLCIHDTKPGIYFEMGAENFGLYSGVYMPDKNQLQSIREGIEQNIQRIQVLLKNRFRFSFVKFEFHLRMFLYSTTHKKVSKIVY